MPLSRRHFLGTLGAGAASAAVGAPLQAASPDDHRLEPIAADWDVSWVDRLTGKFRAVFDSPEINEGGGMFRAIIWRDHHKAVYGTPIAELSSVLVIRHVAIAMVMNDGFWARYKLGKTEKIKDPETKKWSMVNPYRVAPPGTPPQWAGFSLEAFMQGGGIVLGCNLAFREMVSLVADAEKLGREAARAKTLEYLIPGVILQPSGVFAVMRAQQAGCHYMLAS